MNARKVLILKNIPWEGPGLLEELLKVHPIAYDIVDLEKGDALPAIKQYGALFVFGGPDSANDQTLKMHRELAFIQEALDRKLFYLGICLGMQTLVKAAGGKVCKSAAKEVGWRNPQGGYFEIALTPEGKSDPLFQGLTSPFKIFQLHGETVKLTKDMKLLAVSESCRNQIIQVGNRAYGIQGHLELTPELLNQWRTADPDLIPLDQEALTNDYTQVSTEYTRVGKTILTHFLKLAGLITG